MHLLASVSEIRDPIAFWEINFCCICFSCGTTCYLGGGGRKKELSSEGFEASGKDDMAWHDIQQRAGDKCVVCGVWCAVCLECLECLEWLKRECVCAHGVGGQGSGIAASWA